MVHIRGYIYIFSACLALGIFSYFSLALPSIDLKYIRLTEVYGFVSLIFLYFALLATPLFADFPNLPFKPLYLRARRALGVSTFSFAFLHTLIGFFKLLGGFSGLAFLGSRDLYDVYFATGALFILFVMAVTSNDWSVRVLGPYWKRIHRFVYLAGFIVLFHVLTIGSHFISPYSFIFSLFAIAVGVLLILESFRIDKKIRNNFVPPRSFTPLLPILLACIAGLYVYIFTPGSSQISIHSEHIHAHE